MAAVGLHISQALKGRSKKALEFTQLIKAIGALGDSFQQRPARRGAARSRRGVLTGVCRTFRFPGRRVQEQG